MSPGEMRSGVADYGRPRRRTKPVVLAPKPPVCVCGTDIETSVCPANCPTRVNPQEPS